MTRGFPGSGRSWITDFIFEQSGDICLLHLSGELTNNYADKLQQALVSLLERSEYVVMDLTKVTLLDAGCFRLFCAAYRIFITCNKQLFLISPDTDIIAAEGAQGPSDRFAHCVAECRQGCLWSNREI